MEVETLGELGFSESHDNILDSVLAGGPNWERYKSFDGTCLEDCPYYDRCSEGEGPARVCSPDWRAAPTIPEVLGVLLHVAQNFEYYNRGDFPLSDCEALGDIKALARDALSAYDDDDSEFSEGAVKTRLHRRRERNSAEAQKKKRKAFRSGQLVCEACGVDYKALYGAAGLSVIECHHEIPLGSAEHTGKTRQRDLRLLCANCHRLSHSELTPVPLDKLRSMVAPRKNS